MLSVIINMKEKVHTANPFFEVHINVCSGTTSQCSYIFHTDSDKSRTEQNRHCVVQIL